MKKENILRAVRIIVLVIFCLFAAKVFIGKNGSGSNDSNLTAATKKNKVSEKNSTGTNSGNSSKNTSKKKKEKEKTEVSEEKSTNTGNRKYKIDYDHIIGGDISSNGEKVTGGHTLLKGDVRIVKKIGAPSKNGVYKASVEIRKPDGTWQKKTSNGGVNTMFPESWDEAKVIDEINSAWENRKDLKGRDNNMWQGISKSGVVMRGYKSPRITAYPVFEGDR
jgi:mafB1